MRGPIALAFAVIAIVPSAAALGAGIAGGPTVEAAPQADASVYVQPSTPEKPATAQAAGFEMPYHDPFYWEESQHEGEERAAEEADRAADESEPEAAAPEEYEEEEPSEVETLVVETLTEIENPATTVRSVVEEAAPPVAEATLIDRILTVVGSVWTAAVVAFSAEEPADAAPVEELAAENAEPVETQTVTAMPTDTVIEGAAVALTAVAAGAVGWALGFYGAIAAKLKKLLVVAGFTRLAKDALLDHNGRDKLYAIVRERPGITLADLTQAHGGGRSTVTYHLRVLEREGMVTSRREGRARLYFAADVGDARHHAAALATLQHKTTRAVAERIGANPGTDQQALCQGLGLTPSLAHWHVTRLETAGVVSKVRDGRHVRYFPTESWATVSLLSRA